MGSVSGSASSYPYSASDYPSPPPPPPVPTEPATAPKKPSKANSVRKKQSRPMQRKQEISEVPLHYTSENPKYRVGKALLSSSELQRAGQYCMDLHNYYIHNADKLQDIIVAFKERHFLQLEGTEGIFIVAFSDLFDLFNLDALDLSLVRYFALHMQQETRIRTGKKCGYIDPQIMTVTLITLDRDGLVRYAHATVHGEVRARTC
ncbi:hypothetical protein GQ55_4G113900 [Panicum hallii var. hallii]|uniref:Uncharacterized protein n=1 Tax=Panicum hallii var. hallii TaxID=1504633 RepID=A0A2T7DXM8_9POAL|nr:hypothetical protein GQ55_4G113900 [Panicum hallii var. hallii]